MINVLKLDRFIMKTILTKFFLIMVFQSVFNDSRLIICTNLVILDVKQER